jgi:hypothetical protein
MPREDETIETALATVRDLARFMDSYLGKRDWVLAGVHDIEAFLAALPRGRKRRLTVLRQFFRSPGPRRSCSLTRPAGRPPGSPPGSPDRPSCWPGTASFSAAGQRPRTLTRTRPCSRSSP